MSFTLILLVYLQYCFSLKLFALLLLCLLCFDAVGCAAGRASSLQKNWVVGCWCGYLFGSRCRFAHGPADAIVTVSCSSKSRLVLPFWWRLTRIVPYKGPLNGCCCCCCCCLHYAVKTFAVATAEWPNWGSISTEQFRGSDRVISLLCVWIIT